MQLRPPEMVGKCYEFHGMHLETLKVLSGGVRQNRGGRPVCRKGIRLWVLMISSLISAGCQMQSQPADSQEVIDVKQSPGHMRTTVPLVRPIASSDQGPLELDFDVLPLRGNEAPTVFIGVRVSGGDLGEAYDLADMLMNPQVSANVQLFRVTEAGLSPVPLLRKQAHSPVDVRTVVLSADGYAPDLMASGADGDAMQAAGLEESGVAYRALQFSYARELPVGRYHLVISAVGNREALVQANAEWLVAYSRIAK